MPDTNWTPGESNDTRDDLSFSDSIRIGTNAAQNRRDANRALIHDAFPDQGTPKGSHEGSQSVAPSSKTTPDFNPDYSDAEHASQARVAAASRLNRTVSKSGRGIDLNLDLAR
jgi:hypothetical protein